MLSEHKYHIRLPVYLLLVGFCACITVYLTYLNIFACKTTYILYSLLLRKVTQ